MNDLRQRRLLFAAHLALIALLVTACGSGTNPAPHRAPRNTVVVRVQPGTDIDALARDYGATVLDRLPEKRLYQLQWRDSDDETEAMALWERDERLLLVDPDDGIEAPETGAVHGSPIHVPFDFLQKFDARYHSIAAGGSVNQAAYAQVHLGRGQTLARGAGTIVAVLDTGVQQDHPNLRDQLLPGYNSLAPGAPPADTADGVGNRAFGHGTMVAGIIARLAPDAKILPVRVLNADGSGSILDVVRGIRWAIAHRARVLNLSFGSPTASTLLKEAIEEAHDAGCVVVVSAGNAASATPQYPAGFGDVLTVAAVDADDRKADYSNFGDTIRLCAPGTGIRSTFADGGYAAWSGTSFAAPFVSAAAALVGSAYPNASGEEIAERLLETARSLDRKNPDYALQLGHGILDIEKALTASED